MNSYLLLKTIHILSATILFGTGLGTAYFMWMAHRSRNIYVIRATSRHVIVADWIFTTPAVLIQPITGALLMRDLGWSFVSAWFSVVAGLYVLIGLCWVPVVFLQYRIAGMARDASSFELLPDAYYRLFRLWVGFGIPAFVGVIFLFIIMVFKPGVVS